MKILKDNESLDLDVAGYERGFVCHCATLNAPHVHKRPIQARIEDLRLHWRTL